MRTILVPTDFSATATNAAHYAVELGKQIGVSSIVLYHTFHVPIGVGANIMAPATIDLESLERSAKEEIRKFKALLAPLAGDIHLETLVEFNLLVDGIDAACVNTKADLIIMGITGGDALDETLIGSNTISVAKRTSTPLIIIPAQAKFSAIKSILLVSDFRDVEATTPIDKILHFVNDTKAKLFVLHVCPGEETGKEIDEQHILENMLKGSNPEFMSIISVNFTESINEYAQEIKADIIISVPKRHGWFDSLFKRSRTNMLAFHTYTPLMVTHK
ncbi:universal stress protein [Chitinophagaceae bacterium LWZ2-11]